MSMFQITIFKRDDRKDIGNQLQWTGQRYTIDNAFPFFSIVFDTEETVTIRMEFSKIRQSR